MSIFSHREIPLFQRARKLGIILERRPDHKTEVVYSASFQVGHRVRYLTATLPKQDHIPFDSEYEILNKLVDLAEKEMADAKAEADKLDKLMSDVLTM